MSLRDLASGIRSIVATKYNREDLRERVRKASRMSEGPPGPPLMRLGRRPGLLQTMALLSIISLLLILDGVQRRNRLLEEGAGMAAGEVVAKRGPSAEDPAARHEVVLRVALPDNEIATVATEVNPEMWATLGQGDLVRVKYATGEEVGTLAIRSIEPGPPQRPHAGAGADTPPSPQHQRRDRSDGADRSD